MFRFRDGKGDRTLRGTKPAPAAEPLYVKDRPAATRALAVVHNLHDAGLYAEEIAMLFELPVDGVRGVL